jgi:hypothetical protein
MKLSGLVRFWQVFNLSFVYELFGLSDLLKNNFFYEMIPIVTLR